VLLTTRPTCLMSAHMMSDRFYMNGSEGIKFMSVRRAYHLLEAPPLGRYVTIFMCIKLSTVRNNHGT
jgi:hypothetical protein